MLTLEMEKTFIAADDCLTDLRQEVGNKLAVEPEALIGDTPLDPLVSDYKQAAAQHLSGFVTEITREELGDDVSKVPRLELFRFGAPVIRDSVRVETVLLSRLADTSPELSKRQKIGRHVSRAVNWLLARDEKIYEIESEALLAFRKKINEREFGSIAQPEDLGEVAREVALEIVPKQLAVLADNSKAA